ncbi:MAG: hypothetical protein SNJ70_06825 [Armatimonadota bacterium]
MRFFVQVLILIFFIGLIGYNQYRFEKMREEVKSITSKFQSEGKSDGDKDDLVTNLAKAERHTKRAKALLEKKEYEQAKIEMDKALESLSTANKVSTDIIGDTAHFFGNTKDRAVRMFKKAWDDISTEANGK